MIGMSIQKCTELLNKMKAMKNDLRRCKVFGDLDAIV